MSRDSYYNQDFKCKKCKLTVRQYTWVSNVNDHLHENCNGKLIPVYEEIPETPGIIITSKHSKGRTKAEREKRRSDDFKKNILPTLTGPDRLHFEKKFKKK